jgi:hypothetical protein
MNIILNVILFKIAWLSTVLGSANDMPLLGPLAVAVAVGVHLKMAANPAREALLLLLAGIIGLTWDSIMVTAGWVSYPNGTLVPGFAPYWIVAMWILFATTLNIAFRWLREKPWTAALLGGVFGPLSYFGGASAGAVVLLQPVNALVALSVAWAILMPALLALGRQFDGYGRQPLETAA